MKRNTQWTAWPTRPTTTDAMSIICALMLGAWVLTFCVAIACHADPGIAAIAASAAAVVVLFVVVLGVYGIRDSRRGRRGR